MSDVLVLNRSCVAINCITWQDAFGDICSGRAEVWAEYPDRVVHTARETFPVPSIIRLLTDVNAGAFKRPVKFNRNNVWLRDSGHCMYCGHQVARHEFTLDHVLPRCLGGKTTWANVVVAEARMTLKTKPKAPGQMSLTSSPAFPRKGNIPPSWRDYVGTVSYWHGELESDKA
jgi:5-methylcytosine-specific restriction endonuclease McrA